MLSLLICTVLAHTQLFRVGNNPRCLRPTGASPETKDAPIKDLMSRDMICGKGPTGFSTESCQVDAGSSLDLIYGHGAPQDSVIDPSHVGPCNVYLVAAERNQQPPTSGWFKIMQGTWDPVNKWCVDKLRKDRGVLRVPIPRDLKAGNYILRTELNALHEGDAGYHRNPVRGAQFYIFCADITVRGNGNGVPPRSETVSIPGYLNYDSPGVVYNVYNQGIPVSEAGRRYPTLGPAVASLVQGGVVTPIPPPAPQPRPAPQPQTQPQAPSNAPPAPSAPQPQAPAPAPPAEPTIVIQSDTPKPVPPPNEPVEPKRPRCIRRYK
jgi:cellulase